MTHRLSRLTLCCLVAAFLACLAAPALAQSAGIAQAGPRLSADADLAAINDLVPGFGGMFVDADGVLTVYMKPGATLDLKRAFGPEVRVLDADFEFRQLLGWRDTMRGLMDAPGLVLLDADESRNRVRVGVEAGSSRTTRVALAARLREMGIPRRAVVFEEVAPIYEMQTLRDAFDPVPGGVEIHWSNFLCTLGFNVKRGPSTTPTDACYFMTNDHCTDVQGQVTGTTYRQPAFGVQIGVEVLDPPFFTGAPCPPGRICRYSDAALAQYFDPADCEFGAIARTDGFQSITIDPNVPRWKIVSKLSGAVVGHRVAKVGRTTGWTEGIVSDTCVDVNVAGQNITRLCQSIVGALPPNDPDHHLPIVGGGDSGSPVFLRRIPTSVAALVGILWGGDQPGTVFVFSPIKNIEHEFGFGLTVH